MRQRTFYDKVLRMLREEGDKTARELIIALNADVANVYKAILAGRQEKQIHVAGWAEQRNEPTATQRYRIVMVYGFGPGEDAVKPKPKRRRYDLATTHNVRQEPGVTRPELEARITQSVLDATRAVLARDPDNCFASMLGQMGAV